MGCVIEDPILLFIHKKRTIAKSNVKLWKERKDPEKVAYNEGMMKALELVRDEYNKWKDGRT